MTYISAKTFSTLLQKAVFVLLFAQKLKTKIALFSMGKKLFKRRGSAENH